MIVEISINHQKLKLVSESLREELFLRDLANALRNDTNIWKIQRFLENLSESEF